MRLDLRGTAISKSATGSTFAELFRRWTSGSGGTTWLEPGIEARRCARPTTDRISTKRQPQSTDFEPAGPTASRVAAGSVDRWTALGTTSHFAIVDGSASGAVEIEVTGPAEAELQVTAVALGDGRLAFDLPRSKVHGAKGKSFSASKDQGTTRCAGSAFAAFLGADFARTESA